MAYGHRAEADTGTAARMLILLGVPLALLGARFIALDHLPLTLCTFRLATGLPCPGCGVTRAVCLVTRGYWIDSLHRHPAGLAVVVLAAWYWLHAALALLSGSRDSAAYGEKTVRRLSRGHELALYSLGLLTFWAWNLLQFARSGEALMSFRSSVLGRILAVL